MSSVDLVFFGVEAGGEDGAPAGEDDVHDEEDHVPRVLYVAHWINPACENALSAHLFKFKKMSGMKLKWKSDFDKQCVIHNFEKRGWIKATSEGKKLQFQTTGTSTGLTYGWSSKSSTLSPASASAKCSKFD